MAADVDVPETRLPVSTLPTRMDRVDRNVLAQSLTGCGLDDGGSDELLPIEGADVAAGILMPAGGRWVNLRRRRVEPDSIGSVAEREGVLDLLALVEKGELPAEPALRGFHEAMKPVASPAKHRRATDASCTRPNLPSCSGFPKSPVSSSWIMRTTWAPRIGLPARASARHRPFSGERQGIAVPAFNTVGTSDAGLEDDLGPGWHPVVLEGSRLGRDWSRPHVALPTHNPSG